MRHRVLIVDDSALTRALVVRQLAEEDYEVLQAGDGAEALAICRVTPPDVVLLDVVMPVMDGHETLQRLKRDPLLHDVPVVFLTGLTDAEDVARGLRLGAHDYLRKPFEAIELVARVRAAVRTGVLQETLRERNDQLEHAASTDALTGLFNRRFLQEHAARAASAARRHGTPLGVVLLDVDHFKAINDAHGHEAGDSVLVDVGHRLSARLREEDVLGRWGGEEFLVVTAGTDAEGVAALSEALRSVISGAPFRVDGRDLKVTASAGWAIASGPSTSFEAVTRAADAGLYAAKAAGRDTVRPGPHA